jgi:hypothetical protein
MDKENILYTYTMEYCFAIKNGITPFARKWMELEIILLSKLSQSQKEKHYIISLVCGICKKKRHESRRETINEGEKNQRRWRESLREENESVNMMKVLYTCKKMSK